MSRRFTFSKTVSLSNKENSQETFTAVEFDSFDEAIKAVEKGIYERSIEIKAQEALVATPPISNDSTSSPVVDVNSSSTSRPIIRKK